MKETGEGPGENVERTVSDDLDKPESVDPLLVSLSCPGDLGPPESLTRVDP